jgi:hypothetical protein
VVVETNVAILPFVVILAYAIYFGLTIKNQIIQWQQMFLMFDLNAELD